MVAGQVAGVDPDAFKIVDGKLYLGWSKAGMEKWSKKGIDGMRKDIDKADEMWVKVKKG
jgi:hypothetical protein